uniref:Inositol-1-monophosphatase n=2 Tax=Lutzomyia longipalpis TaxID=7200 RepID=A0A1B0CNZ5_LUTLO
MVNFEELSGFPDFATEAKLQECFNYVVNLVQKGGSIVEEGFTKTKEVKIKAFAADLVTEYDKRVEDLIIEGIREKYPNHKFIAEESAAKNPLTADPTWIIDPIDGTTNFVHSNPLIAISVALAVDGKLLMAICLNPIHKELYTAIRGRGAFLNGTPIHCSIVTELKNAVISIEVSLAWADRLRDEVIGRTHVLSGRVIGIRSLGSIVLALCYVARGSLDAYQMEYLQPWDIAAGALLIQEAGGVVKNHRGGEYDIMKAQVLVAGTQELYDQMLAVNRECEGKVITFAKP